jgi:hypothetical protein
VGVSTVEGGITRYSRRFTLVLRVAGLGVGDALPCLRTVGAVEPVRRHRHGVAAEQFDRRPVGVRHQIEVPVRVPAPTASNPVNGGPAPPGVGGPGTRDGGRLLTAALRPSPRRRSGSAASRPPAATPWTRGRPPPPRSGRSTLGHESLPRRRNAPVLGAQQVPRRDRPPPRRARGRGVPGPAPRSLGRRHQPGRLGVDVGGKRLGNTWRDRRSAGGRMVTTGRCRSEAAMALSRVERRVRQNPMHGSTRAGNGAAATAPAPHPYATILSATLERACQLPWASS